MSLPRLNVDFVTPRTPAILPLVVAAVGIAAVCVTLFEQRSLSAEAAGLELRLAGASPVREVPETARDSAIAREARSITQLLGTPWGVVLDDLEAASRDSGDSIAVLSVQPDRDTRRVTLVAEARSLPVALKYVQRLQSSRALLHPLLDSHEVRTESTERPVRVQITAEWNLRS